MTPQHSDTDTQTPPPTSLETLLDEPLEIKLHLLRHYAELARLLAQEILEDEVTDLAGERYSRNKPHQGRYRRWGTNPGSIRLDGERVPIDVPRVRDTQAGQERPLESYGQMKRPVDVDTKLEQAILLGLSQRDYQRVASAFVDGFGLSQASVSRRFQERSQQALEAFEARSLTDETYLGLWLDGKHVAGEQMIICLGVTEEGYKQVLGFVQATTEHAEPIKGLLRELIDRGLRFEHGLLCVIDGGKGLRAAIEAIFGEYAQIQRCQWHKRENVVRHLPKADQPAWRRTLQRAYQRPTYAEAKAELVALHEELQQLNRSAARSLMEGLEETLTLHRLGLFEELGRSLKTTNCIESLNSQLERFIGRVRRWHHSDQRHRWMALALLEAEQRMRRLTGYRHLPKLKKALQEAIPHSE